MYFKNKSLSTSLIFFKEEKSERSYGFSTLKNDFDFAIYEEVVNNFGRSDDDMYSR
jgi:hypothetical protein